MFITANLCREINRLEVLFTCMCKFCMNLLAASSSATFALVLQLTMSLSFDAFLVQPTYSRQLSV